MNKKGQALVEFIIILPILIFMLFAIIDFGMITYNKNRMESLIDDIKEMYQKEESDDTINKFIKENIDGVKVTIEQKDKYIYIDLTKTYKFLTPGMELLMKDYKIDIERTVYNG